MVSSIEFTPGNPQKPFMSPMFDIRYVPLDWGLSFPLLILHVPLSLPLKILSGH